MSSPSGLSAGLAFLPNWLNDAKDVQVLDALLSGWVKSSGWRAAGVVWPADSKAPDLVIQARADGVERGSFPPPEVSEVLRALRSGSVTVVWQVPGSSGRLYAPLTPTGRPGGLIWAERAANEPWTEADRNYLRLSGRLIERSPALAAAVGPVVDPERLQHRLGDAAVIAGRMAHDFDNILTGIIGFSDLSVPLLPAGSQQAKFVAEIGKVGQRGIQFTQQLHQLSRSGQSKPQPGSVAAVVTREEARLRQVLPNAPQVVTAIPSGLHSVAMDGGPLSAVLGHLLENASEASPPGGRVVVTAKLVELGVADARSYLGQVGPGPHVEVTVQDSGPGIKPEVRAKLFVEPFYTTKVRHRGLGLAIVYRTLCAHRGGVRIESAAPPETGTVVRVVIPPAVARPAVAPTIVATTPALGG
jgi:signal transduction histidine kinase